jgi:hypothetical protein
MERGLVAYWNEDLVDMCNLGTVKYCFVLRSNLEMNMFKLDRC